QFIGIMFLTRTEYDRGVNTFSPEGRLFQVRIAWPSWPVEKRVTSNLLVPSSIEKIFEVDKHIGCARSGRRRAHLIERARVEATHHWFVHGEQIHVEDVTRSVSNMALAFGDDASKGAMSRPSAWHCCSLEWTPPAPGCSTWTLLAPTLIISYRQRSRGCPAAAEEAYHSGMSLRDALVLALKILKQVMEEKLDMTNVEVVTVTPDRKYHLLARRRWRPSLPEVGSSSGP
uniref:PROTEASOME_ALPHA_1 domain-containing protein n=1 Tax=Macrostomum lignano TaxID=282301 RepID=A0A1I8FRC7_9PLAT